MDGTRYIVAAFGDANWVGNVRAARRGTLTRSAKSEDVTLAEVAVEDRGPVLRAFLAQVRGGTRFFGRQTPEQIVAGTNIRCFESRQLRPNGVRLIRVNVSEFRSGIDCLCC